MNKLLNYITKPKNIVLYLFNKAHFKFIPDKLYLKIKFRLEMGYKLDLDNPKTFSEKMQWLKLYDRKEIYIKMVDKYESKKIVEKKLGAKYVVPTYGIFNSFEEIDFDKLPTSFVIKCTHDSGGLVIVNDKEQLNYGLTKKKINKSLKRKYFYSHREWAYKNVKPRILIEKLLVNDNKEEVIEYNFFCFNGEPKFVMTCHGDKRIKRYNDFYDINFNKLKLKCIYDNSNIIDTKPNNFQEMIEVSRKLSKNIPHLRVDLYVCNGNIYVGELTFCHWAGFAKFEPEEWNYIIGDYVDLTGIKESK